jgi:hypothetical protein
MKLVRDVEPGRIAWQTYQVYRMGDVSWRMKHNQ